MAVHVVISDRTAHRKRPSRGGLRVWAIVRGAVAFVVTSIVLLASAWLGGDLRRDPANTTRAPLALRGEMIFAEPLLATPIEERPALASDLRPVRRLHNAAPPRFETGPEPEALEVVSAEELDTISQAHRNRTVP